MADRNDSRVLADYRAGQDARREERIRKVMDEGDFSRKQAVWLVDRDLDNPRSNFSPSDTPIGPGSGYGD